MALDFHVHYLGDDYLDNMSHYISLAESREYVREVVVRSIESLQGSALDLQTYLDGKDSLGIEESVIFGLADTPQGCFDLNTRVAELAASRPGEIYGFGTVPTPDVEAARTEMRRVREDLGFLGIKLYPSLSNLTFRSEQVLQLLDFASQLDLVVLTDCSFACWDSPGYLGSDNRFHHLLQALGQLSRRPKIVAAHLGGGLVYFRDMYRWAYGEDHFDTLWFDISPFFPASMIGAALEVVQSERLLFGSDFPFSTGRENLDNLAQLDLSPADRAGILGGNARNLLGLDDSGLPDSHPAAQ